MGSSLTRFRVLLQIISSLTLVCKVCKLGGKIRDGTNQKSFKKYTSIEGYRWFAAKPMLDVRLNKIWRLESKQNTWLYKLKDIWKTPLEPKMACVTCSLVLGGLALGYPLIYSGTST